MKRFALLLLFATSAFGQALRPTVAKSFTPDVIAVNQITTLTITLTNPNGADLTGASLQDSYPAGLVNAGPASTTCGNNSVVTTATSMDLFYGTIPANGSCTMTVPVTASSVGSYENSTGALFSSGPASITYGDATLQVVPPIPAFSGRALLLLGATLGAAGMLLSRR
ncbi:MAG TPA: hypothetical protein VG323_11140 [Thermoanaerobaculia bacterium]|nr:hypothetical protein [Thermoanaerobaculia bacterium]